MEVELEMMKASVMALTVAANCSAEGDTYRALADAVMQVRTPSGPGHHHRWCAGPPNGAPGQDRFGCL